MHCDKHFKKKEKKKKKKSSFDKSTETKSFEANEKFTLNKKKKIKKKSSGAGLIFFFSSLSQDEFGSSTIIKAVKFIII